jgi:DNA-binding NtrC family response regulator
MNAAPERHVLLVEDTLPLARSYIEFLKTGNYRVDHVDTGRKALNFLKRTTPDVVLLDVKLPDMSGLDILDQLTEQGLACPIVVITAHGSIKLAVDAMRAGAADFLVKPFNAQRLKNALAAVFERVAIAGALPAPAGRRPAPGDAEPPVAADTRSGYGGYIGSSAAMQAVYRTIEAAATSKASVFVTGESGTGKELCAEAIHRLGPRADKPLIALNCAAIPRDLMESEIFGHLKGAFSGAVADREGAASLADGGTLFLDEICDMNVDLQAKLLRFVQSESYRPVGGTELRRVDVRFICATNKEPLEEVAEGRLREDLYYRLHVIPIHLPPLRARGTDVVEIAERLLADIAAEEGKKFARFAGDVKAALLAYDWPGNVRQLENVIRNIVVMHAGEVVTVDMLPAPIDRCVLHQHTIKAVG